MLHIANEVTCRVPKPKQELKTDLAQLESAAAIFNLINNYDKGEIAVITKCEECKNLKYCKSLIINKP